MKEAIIRHSGLFVWVITSLTVKRFAIFFSKFPVLFVCYFLCDFLSTCCFWHHCSTRPSHCLARFWTNRSELNLTSLTLKRFAIFFSKFPVLFVCYLLCDFLSTLAFDVTAQIDPVIALRGFEPTEVKFDVTHSEVLCYSL